MIKKEEYTERHLQIAKFAKAMSHPARVHILEKLSKMNSGCFSGDLFYELPICRSALSLHLKELKNAGLIKGHTKAPYINYCINNENWQIVKVLFKEMFEA